MKAYQREFLDFAVGCDALSFGAFTLKSGRVSPYFFNSGLFNTGARLGQLAGFYAQAIVESRIGFDMFYGPAYKGIPLVAAIAIALAGDHACDLPYAFNRKESKAHGEAGVIVGTPLAGKVLIVDDVISAGTSVRESVEIIRNAGATPVGVAIALDRQERGQGALSAVQEVEQTFGLKVISIASVDTLLAYLEGTDALRAHLEAIRRYRARYGA